MSFRPRLVYPREPAPVVSAALLLLAKDGREQEQCAEDQQRCEIW